ncbi:MAG: YkvA family protein [Acidimicrobiia bacterium]
MSDVLAPDEIIRPGRTADTRRWLKEAVLALPRMVKLIGRLIRDPRVPTSAKALALVSVGYVLSPVDIIPDFIPVIGETDDVLVVVLALHRLIRAAGHEVVLEHWDGPQDILEIVEQAVDLAAGLVPARLSWLVRRMA